MHDRRTILAALAVTLLLSGGGCLWRNRPPQVLNTQPTLYDVASAVNANSAKVSSLRSTARLSSEAIPVGSISANIALLRPQKFRLTGTLVNKRVVDAGSNDQELWFWARTSLVGPPAPLYYCSHERYPQSVARQVMPLDPKWLVEAFGLVEFANDEHHEGPNAVGRNRLEIRTVRQTAEGAITKLTVVDARSALVVEQHIYDPMGNLLASALTSQHAKDPGTGAWLPRQILLSFAQTGTRLQVYLNDLEVNTIGALDEDLWQRPQIQGATTFDLGDPNLRLRDPDAIAPPLGPARTGRRLFPRWGMR